MICVVILFKSETYLPCQLQPNVSQLTLNLVCQLQLPADSYYTYDNVCIGSSMSWDCAGSLFSQLAMQLATCLNKILHFVRIITLPIKLARGDYGHLLYFMNMYTCLDNSDPSTQLDVAGGWLQHFLHMTHQIRQVCRVII